MKRKLSLFLVIVLLLTALVPVSALDNLDAILTENVNFMLKTVPEPHFGSVAGEWTVFSVARSGLPLPDGYVDKYLKHIDQVVTEKKGDLHRVKYTEYSRLIVALSALGVDARNVAGYDLVAPLANFKKVKKQGINGPIWALIALDTFGYDIPTIEDKEQQNSRQRMVDEILSREVSGGGWALMGDKTDPDITAMALYALARYGEKDPKVKAANERAVKALSEIQHSTGGFTTFGAENSESSAQVIIALTTLGIDPETDPRFVKTDVDGQKKSVVTALMTYRCEGGGFKHVHEEPTFNGMGTDQAVEALLALQRFRQGKSPLFYMDDVKPASMGGGNTPAPSGGTKTPEGFQGFTDLEKSWAKDLILESKGYGIANGAKKFKPDKAITRGEFAVGLVNGLGLQKGPKEVSFGDVKDGWYKDAVAIAASNGIIEGMGDGTFAPDKTIKREQAMAMIERALAVKGIKSGLTEKQVEEYLAKFPDGKEVSKWARAAAAFNIEKKIIQGRPAGIIPKGEITRAEAVKVIYVTATVK